MPSTSEIRTPYSFGSDDEGVSIVQLYLTSRNVEASIDQYLLENGVILDARTRAFLANIREAVGAVSRQAGKAVCSASQRDFS